MIGDKYGKDWFDFVRGKQTEYAKDYWDYVLDGKPMPPNTVYQGPIGSLSAGDCATCPLKHGCVGKTFCRRSP